MSTQFAPVAAPTPPSQAEIMKLLRERMPGLVLYNPAEIWVRTEVHGLEHFFPPDLKGAVEPHPVTGVPTKCDGTYLVRGRYITQKDSSGKTIEGQDAQAVVAFVIHRERLGEMGICWLPGRDPEEDEALKGFARDKWLAFQHAADDNIIARRREFKSNWEKNPARTGVPVPAPTPAENAAMERLQEREHKQTYGFECSVEECPGYATDDWVKYATHMSAAHQVRAKRSTDGTVTLTNQAGDTQVVGSFGATDGKPVPVKDEAEDPAAGLETAAAALPKATRRGKKKG